MNDIINDLSNPIDISAAAIGYATGYAVDVFAFSGGTDPATAAFVWATGAIGVRRYAGKIFEAIIERNKNYQLGGSADYDRMLWKAEHRGESNDDIGTREKLLRLLRVLDEAGREELCRNLKTMGRLWSEGLVPEERLEREIENVINIVSGSSDCKLNPDAEPHD